MKNFFKIENFSCGYRTGFKIENVNFSIHKGSFAGIIGPNGSGKSTLFKGVTQELKAHKGSILLNNINISNMSYKEKARNIAIVTQKINAEAITAYEYVLMGRIPHKKHLNFFESKYDHAIAQKYMEMTDTWRMRNKYMNELSGGEQQLVSIARALTQEPQLLLLDEPTSYLDITHQVQVLNLIQKLNDELGLTVLMIIHDLNLASEYCDYLIMMKNGTQYTQGTPNEIVNYENIEAVYDTVVITKTNPLSNNPVVFLVSQKTLDSLK